ncbi:SDR family NAD(P)-dependent oxidoreductase [Xanthomonadaceae bacterium XH05]|nr:SDR family NAD(P)-dependent oxidoreductase [Xanthomonadaceae bacterium XH05]
MPAIPLPAADALADRTILITGVNGGLGETLTHACAKAGAQVILVGRRLPKLTRLYDALVVEGARDPALYPMDLTGAAPDDYETLATSIGNECGRLDGIVHCAAEFKGLASLENMPLEDWFTGLHVNLTAPFLLTRACLGLLRQRQDASVLFLLDDPDRTTRTFWNSYGVAKQALRGLVSTLHAELERSPVRVYGVQPGPMRTVLRSRAYFAEDPSQIPHPSAYAPACVALLGPQGKAIPEAFVTLQPGIAKAPRPLGLTTISR